MNDIIWKSRAKMQRPRKLQVRICQWIILQQKSNLWLSRTY